MRAPAPALARLTKPKHSSLLSNIKKGVGASKPKKDACASNRRSSCDLQEKPLRERVMHLLALRPYRRPELILRLQKDGLTAGDKNMLDSVLMEVFLFLFLYKHNMQALDCVKTAFMHVTLGLLNIKFMFLQPLTNL